MSDRDNSVSDDNTAAGTHTDVTDTISAAHEKKELENVAGDGRFPVPDPGLEEYLPRLTDVDAQAADRAERQVVVMFGCVPILAILFVVIYFAVPNDLNFDFAALHSNAQHLGLGLTLGLAILLIGVGAVQWSRQLMGNHELVEERHPSNSTEDDRAAIMTEINAGVDESDITRRKMIGVSLLGALGILAVPAVVLLADLGPFPTGKKLNKTLEYTLWSDATDAKPIRLVNDVTFTPIKAADMMIGQLVNAEPASLDDLEGVNRQIAKAKTPVIIVRMPPDSLKIPDSRKDWHVGGILAYSKICTHVGCAISLWEQQTHHVLCPCHQSTFDLADAGVVRFGPAARALPQLPISVDDEGYLVTTQGFTVPVGPSYFERDYYPEDEGK